ncbi:mitochondrial ribosomal protein L37-domain-containing protein [Phlebopus sp. FC_14]|nr:mitochondrial ribosomal protein L37-domain-containing protein [Phlebopus sp. FC_14]
MSLLALRCASSQRTLSVRLVRNYAEKSGKKPAEGSDAVARGISSCPAGTILTGLNYLKDQPPVLAMADEDYPSWLWDLTKPKTVEDNGPGGAGEKRRLRKEHRQHLKDKNLYGSI